MEASFCAYKKTCPGLLLIDDRCLAMPQFEHSGGCADLELYSTGYAKFVDLGWGGFGHVAAGLHYERKPVTYVPQDHEHLVAQFRGLKECPGHFEYKDSDWLDASEVETSWQDFRAQVLVRVNASTAHRAAINECYRRCLPREHCLPEAFWNWRFHVWVAEPQTLLHLIFAAGLFASSHYENLIPTFGPGQAPNAALLGGHVVNLFNDFRFDLTRAEATANLVATFLKNFNQKPYPWNYANNTTN